MPTITADEFRGNFTVFDDSSKYPDLEIDFWMGLAEKLHSADRWGELLPYGLQLFVAHYLSVDAASKLAPGGVLGQIVGAITSASVDKVSYSRDASAASDPAAGHWNLSSFGVRWRSLSRMVGTGPVQVGAEPDNGNYSAAAWAGLNSTGW